MFICMYIYCSYTENSKILSGFLFMIVKGAALGIINVLCIYMLVDIVDNINLGIKILILVQAFDSTPVQSRINISTHVSYIIDDNKFELCG